MGSESNVDQVIHNIKRRPIQRVVVEVEFDLMLRTKKALLLTQPVPVRHGQTLLDWK